jgi:hypothetical protein
MAAPVINTPAHLEHRIKTPDGRTLAVAEWGDPEGETADRMILPERGWQSSPNSPF